jgi:homoserine acetyltransferase
LNLKKNNSNLPQVTFILRINYKPRKYRFTAIVISHNIQNNNKIKEEEEIIEPIWWFDLILPAIKTLNLNFIFIIIIIIIIIIIYLEDSN